MSYLLIPPCALDCLFATGRAEQLQSHSKLFDLILGRNMREQGANHFCIFDLHCRESEYSATPYVYINMVPYSQVGTLCAIRLSRLQ